MEPSLWSKLPETFIYPMAFAMLLIQKNYSLTMFFQIFVKISIIINDSVNVQSWHQNISMFML